MSSSLNYDPERVKTEIKDKILSEVLEKIEKIFYLYNVLGWRTGNEKGETAPQDGRWSKSGFGEQSGHDGGNARDAWAQGLQ